MTATPQQLPTGWAGLQYPITQVSLAVHDLERTMELYWRAFGWSGWDVFDHQPPAHQNTELRGEQVHYTLKGAEVMVGSLNFELLEPVDGPSLWKEFIAERGEGIASIAVMFHTLGEGEAVKREFAERGMPVTMKANIGDNAITDATSATGRSVQGRCSIATVPPTSTMASVMNRNDHVIPTGINSLRSRIRFRRWSVAARNIT